MNTEAKKPQTLKQMAEDKGNDSVSKKTIYMADPRLLVIEEGFNIRFDTPQFRASIRQMADSWKAGANMPPIVLKQGTLIVTDGHRRTLGALLAIEEGLDLRKVAVMEREGNEVDRLDYMLDTESGQRGYSTLEKGIAYKRYLAWGHTKQEIAKRRKISVTHIEQAVKLANADRELQRLVAEELVSVSAALDAIKEHGDDAGKFLKEMSDNAPTQEDGTGEERKKKVSRRVTNAARQPAPRRLPAKLADRYATNVGELFASAPDLRQKVALAGNEETIAVSARVLKELLEAHAEAEKLRAPEGGEKDAETDPRQASLLAAGEPGTDEGAAPAKSYEDSHWPYPAGKD